MLQKITCQIATSQFAMKLQIISVTDKRFNTELEIDEDCCILDLKDKLTVQDARLIYAGKLLQDTQILKETIKQENNYVHLVVKNPPKQDNAVEEIPPKEEDSFLEAKIEPQNIASVEQEGVEQECSSQSIITEDSPFLTNSLPFSYSLVPIQPRVVTIK